MAQEDKQFKKKNTSQLPSLVDNFFWPIMLLLAVAVFLGGYTYLLKQTYTDLITQQQKRLTQVNKTIEDLKEQDKKLDELKTAGISFDQQEELLINSALPSSYDYASVVIQITSLAERYGFVITGLDVSEMSTDTRSRSGQAETASPLPSGVKGVEISLEAAGGSYSSWREFVNALENSAMLLDVKAVDMSLEDGSYSLELMSYYYPNNN